MPVYAKPIKSSDTRFRGGETVITAPGSESRIPVPDSVVLCNGCNQSVSEGYLVYLDKRELKADQPYDIYCRNCLKKYFPKAIIQEV